MAGKVRQRVRGKQVRSIQTRPCDRCGIDRKVERRSGSICQDCRLVDPMWGKRGD